MVGLFIFGFGTGLTALAALGVPPWDVLHDGIRLHSPLSFGQAAILVGLALVVVSLCFGIKPGVGTIANMIFVGLLIDLTLYVGDGWEVDELVLPLRLGVTIAGIALVGLGSALYIGAEMGAGPRDSLMVLFTTHTRLSLGVARTLIEGTALVGGALLGGALGIGTALFALVIGPSVQLFFRLLRMDVTGARRSPESE